MAHNSVVALLIVLLGVVGHAAALDGFENDPFVLNGQREDFVFKTDEELTAYSKSLPREFPDESVYLAEIATLSGADITPAIFDEQATRELKTAAVPTAYFSHTEEKQNVALTAGTPTIRPTRAPTTVRPSREPTFSLRPTRKPTTMRPTREPTTVRPSREPTFSLRPTRQPTVATDRPTRKPTTMRPTRNPITAKPTLVSARPSMVSARPSSDTMKPTLVSARPSPVSARPTIELTVRPSQVEASAPTLLPSAAGVSFPKALVAFDKRYFNGSYAKYYGTFSDDDAPTTQWTISVWINSTKTDTIIGCFDRTPSNFNGEGLFGTSTSGTLSYWEYKNGYGLDFTGVAKVTTGKRIHVAFVKNGGTGTFYVNGAPDKTATTTNTVSHGNKGFNVGSDARDKNLYFKGYMDNFNMYNYALTAAQVSDMYNYFIQPPTPTPTFAPSAAPTNPTYAPTFKPTSKPSVMPPTVAVILSGANRAPTLGFQLINAMKSSDASQVPGNEIREKYMTLVKLFNTTRQEIISAVFTNSTTGKKYTSVTWNPTHDSAYFTIADSANTYSMFASNYDYSSASYTPTSSVPVAFAGFYGTTARYTGFATNPFATPLASDSDIIMRNVITWMNKGVDATKVSGFGITIAHLPGASSYWFSHDVPTHKWFAANYPLAKVNAINACDNTALDSCLATSQLLVIGIQMGRNDDSAVTATSTNTTQVSNAVRKFMENGGSVMYVHYYRVGTELGNSILSMMGVSPLDYNGYTNYWRKAGFYYANPFSYIASTTDKIHNAIRTLHGYTPLTSADICSSDSIWFNCGNSGFLTKMRYGVDSLRSILNNIDSGSIDLFSTAINKYVLEKMLILLGDKYRTATGVTDATTPVLKYPLAVTDYAGYAAAMFADTSILYRRPAAPAQDDLGTLYCSWWNKLISKTGCADYKNFATVVTRYNDYVASDDGIYPNDVWTATGAFAIPGVPFTVTRLDDRADVTLYVVMWYQRAATTKSMEVSGTNYNYQRPQYVRSPYVGKLVKGQTITITAPHGGPIYFGIVYNGVSRTSTAKLQASFSNVGKHPSILDVGDSAQVNALPTSIKTNPVPIVDIKAPGYEAHFRSDFILGSLVKEDDYFDYSGDNGMAKLLYDVRFNFIEPQMTLAGFKAPGKALTESLPAADQNACKLLTWNCTDTSIHYFSGIQHANFDDRATCGNGCSGNPYDADWGYGALGWGDAHEVGHNMQQSLLQISWVSSTGNRDTWSSYQNRATENSNNIFPYHNRWRYFRKYLNYSGIINSGSWNGHIDDYVTLQSAYARVNKTVSGTVKTVVFDKSCNIAKSYPLGTGLARVAQDAVYADSSYAADNDARMAFYLQLTFIMTGQTVVKGQVTMTNGFEIITLLYQGLRTLQYYSRNDARWKANRDSVGFGLFNRTCASTDPCYSLYGGRDVSGMPGNDYILVMMTYLSGYDFRPHYDIRGLKYSWLAEKQVLAHIASGVANKGPIPTDYYAIDDYPPASIIGGRVKKLPIDGVTAWPFTSWSVSGCASKYT